MFGLLKKDPSKKLTKERDRLLAQAMEVQRSGDLKAYARLIKEIETIEKQIDAINNTQNA